MAYYSSNRKHKNMSHITIMIVIIHHSGPVWPRRSNPEHLGFMTFALIALKTYWWHIIRYINSGVRKKVPTTSSTSNCAQLDYLYCLRGYWLFLWCDFTNIMIKSSLLQLEGFINRKRSPLSNLRWTPSYCKRIFPWPPKHCIPLTIIHMC